MINNKIYYKNLVKNLTKKILNITKHLNNNNKDFNSIRSLLKIVSKRRKILKYLKKKEYNLFLKITKKLKIRK